MNDPFVYTGYSPLPNRISKMLTRLCPLLLSLFACGTPAASVGPTEPSPESREAEDPGVEADEQQGAARAPSEANAPCGNRGQAACAEGLVCDRSLAVPDENISGRCAAPGRAPSEANAPCGNRGQAACAEGLVCDRSLAVPDENISGRCAAPTADTP